jgi:sulfatase maturation enzyme AslB (radical SAM superfamily)
MGCTNYSDLKHTGYVSWQQGKQWLSDWLQRIDIPDFGIMGGEPLINPECRDWLIGARQMLPHSQIRFTTNGLLLPKHQDLIDLMYELGNISFKITVHIDTPELNSSIDQVFKRYSWRPVREYGIDRWVTDNNFRFHVKRSNKFIKTYKNDYNNMMPWNSVSSQAFDACVQQTCPLLHQGKIYKCSTSGLLEQTVSRVSPHNTKHWEKYFEPGMSSNCTHSELTAFIDNFGKPHPRCSQCPDVAVHSESIINHLLRVELK